MNDFHFQLKRHPFLDSIIEKNIDELIHLCLVHNQERVASDLASYKFDPNAMIEGKTPLFKAHTPSFIEILLKAGADPFLEVDGCKFFQRPGFALEQRVDSGWIIELHKRGVDVFEPSPPTGKNLFESFEGSLLSFPAGSVKAGKLTKTILLTMRNRIKQEFHKGQGEGEEFADLYAPMDEDGNSLLHYHILGHVKLLTDRSLDFFIASKNKAGLTPIDLLVRSEDFVEAIFKKVVITGLNILKVVEEAYDGFHGKGAYDSNVLPKIGSKLAFDFLVKSDLPTIKYFIEEKRISCGRLVLYLYSQHKQAYMAHNPDFFKYILDAGLHPIDLNRFVNRMPFTFKPAPQDSLFSSSNDPKTLFFEVLISMDGSLTDEVKVLQKLKQKDGLIELLKQNKSLSSKLYEHLFMFCKASADFEFLLEIGLDSRDLIDSKFICSGNVPSLSAELWKRFITTFQMKYEDFEKIRFRFKAWRDKKRLPINDCSYSFIDDISRDKINLTDFQQAFAQ